jgi:hypothetical protein
LLRVGPSPRRGNPGEGITGCASGGASIPSERIGRRLGRGLDPPSEVTMGRVAGVRPPSESLRRAKDASWYTRDRSLLWSHCPARLDLYPLAGLRGLSVLRIYLVQRPPSSSLVSIPALGRASQIIACLLLVSDHDAAPAGAVVVYVVRIPEPDFDPRGLFPACRPRAPTCLISAGRPPCARVAEASRRDEAAAIFQLVPAHDTGGTPQINGAPMIPWILHSQAWWVLTEWIRWSSAGSSRPPLG